MEKLRRRCESLDKDIKDPMKFKDFYQFTFNFAKNPGQKGLGKFMCSPCVCVYVRLCVRACRACVCVHLLMTCVVFPLLVPVQTSRWPLRTGT